MMTKEHKHAAVLRAIADGVPINEFEVNHQGWSSDEWMDAQAFSSWAFSNQDCWQVRRKPQHIIVNGFKVPKPLDVMPETTVYWPHLTCDELFDSASPVHHEAINAFQRDCAHGSPSAAIAHAKAMLGIDPEAA